MMAVQGFKGVKLNFEYKKHDTQNDKEKILRRWKYKFSQGDWVLRYWIEAFKSDFRGKRSRSALRTNRDFYDKKFNTS